MSRIALVTGGTRGIGLATATALLDAGHRVAVTYRREPPTGLDAFAVQADVTDMASMVAAVAAVESELGVVEILVCNAGTTDDRLLLRTDEESFGAVVDTNLTGAFRAVRAVAPKMVRNRWGRIILVGSVVAGTGSAGQVSYASSKAGLTGMARSLARELASRSITANVVAPGPVATDMLAALTDDRRDAIAEAVPLGRIGEPREVAAAIAFLASEDAGYITGTVLNVDGGLGMGGF